MPLEPHAALRQSLVLGVDFLNLLQRRIGDEGVGDLEVDLRHHLEVGVDELVQGVAHRTLRRVLDRDDAVIGLPFLHRGEDVGNRGHPVIVDARAEFLDRGLMRVRRLRTEVGDQQRFFERDGRRHHLAVDRAQGGVLQRALVLTADLAHDLVFPLRHENPPIPAALQPADLGRQGQALVEQLHNPSVKPIDLLAERVEIHGNSG